MIGFFRKNKDSDSKIFEISIFCNKTKKTFSLPSSDLGTMRHSINFTCRYCRVYEYIMVDDFPCDDTWRIADGNDHEFKIDRGNIKRFIRESRK